MRFLVHGNVAIGWSAKAGCRHLKLLFAFLTGNPWPRTARRTGSRWLPWVRRRVPDEETMLNMVQAVDTTIPPRGATAFVVVRNPYARLVSGFTRVLRPGRELTVELGIPDDFSLMDLLDAIETGRWADNEHFVHHLYPQTHEDWDAAQATGIYNKVVDLEHLDFAQLGALFGVAIPDNLRQWRSADTEPPLETEPRWKDVVFNDAVVAKVQRVFARDFELLRHHGIPCELPAKYPYNIYAD